jgi:hypothetical protein
MMNRAIDDGLATLDGLSGGRVDRPLIGGAKDGAALPYHQPPLSEHLDIEKRVAASLQHILATMTPAKFSAGKNGEIYVYKKTASPALPDLFIKVQTNQQTDALSHEYAIIKALNRHYDELPAFPYAYHYSVLPSGDCVLITEFLDGQIAHNELSGGYTDDKLAILLQIMYVLYYAGTRWKFAHNDLHGGNTIVTRLATPIILSMVIDANTRINIKTSYLIHIIDMGRSSVNGVPVPYRPFIKKAHTTIHTRIDKIISDDVCKVIRRYTKGTDFLSILQSILSIQKSLQHAPAANNAITRSFVAALRSAVRIQVFTARAADRRGRKIIRDTNVDMAAIMRWCAKTPSLNKVRVSADAKSEYKVVVWGAP